MFQKWVFFFNATATTEIYTLSLHDALPICPFFPSRLANSNSRPSRNRGRTWISRRRLIFVRKKKRADRKSTRLNSSHLVTSYAVFCLKKKNHPPPPPSINGTAYSLTRYFHCIHYHTVVLAVFTTLRCSGVQLPISWLNDLQILYC